MRGTVEFSDLGEGELLIRHTIDLHDAMCGTIVLEPWALGGGVSPGASTLTRTFLMSREEARQTFGDNVLKSYGIA